METRTGLPLTNDGGVLPDTLSDTALSEDLRATLGFPGVCGLFTVLSLVLLLRFTSAWMLAGRITGEDRFDTVRGTESRLVAAGLPLAGHPFEDSVLDWTLGMPLLLEDAARDTVPLLGPVPPGVAFFMV